jgi:glycosyltransferase involved in cell wall biosynthesis
MRRYALRAVRVALVHDFLLDVRGAERVFLAMCELWPEADVFTAVYDEKGTEGRFAHRRVGTTFLQRVRPTARSFRPLLPLYPYAIESLDLSAYDLVVSSSSAWAHGVIVDAGTVHVSYCHNPFRYAWSEREATLAARAPGVRTGLRVLLSRWRQWDRLAAQHVDRYVANSHTTRRRMERYWGRSAAVVYPPVETTRFTPVPSGRREDFHLVLAELMPHKRIDVAVDAFNKLGRRLVVVGDGPDMRRLRRLAGPTISFAGRLGDEEVADVLARSRALVVTATEEFGIAALEAQAAGRPVIALARGGVQETIEEGVTGTFFSEVDAGALALTVAAFDDEAIDPEACTANAERFSVERFQRRLGRETDAALSDRGREDAGRGSPRRPLRPAIRPVARR